MNTYPQLLNKIMAKGDIVKPHGREVKEILHARLEVSPFCNIYSWDEIRPIKKIIAYLWKELAWYLSGDRHALHISKYAGLWEKIKNSDGTLNSNYGHLVFHNRTHHPSLGEITLSPFQWASKCLLDDPDSRQAIMTYNTGGFNFVGNDDYICTQHQAFFIRQNKLICFIALRSSDAIFGLTYNMPWWSLVHQMLRLSLLSKYPDLELGGICVDIYSAHIYKQHYDLVGKMISRRPHKWLLSVNRQIPIKGAPMDWYERHLPDYVSINVSSKEAAK